MKNKFFQPPALILLICGLSLFACSCQSKESAGSSERLRVIATIFPVYDFAREIGGEKIELSMILPAGMDPHSYELTPTDIQAICRADLFLFAHFEMEQWIHKVIRPAENANTTVVETARGAVLLALPPSRETLSEQIYEREKPPLAFSEDEYPQHNAESEPVGLETEKPAEPELEITAGRYDPHLWLDLQNARIMVDNITQAFINRDPKNSDTYKRNARLYKRRLSELDATYKAQLAGCKSKILRQSGHRAFAYLALRYGLDYRHMDPLTQPTPSPREILDIFGLNQIGEPACIFYEKRLPAQLEQTMVRDMGLQILALKTVSDVSQADLTAGASFLSVMENNLAQLKKGLQCP